MKIEFLAAWMAFLVGFLSAACDHLASCLTPVFREKGSKFKRLFNPSWRPTRLIHPGLILCFFFELGMVSWVTVQQLKGEIGRSVSKSRDLFVSVFPATFFTSFLFRRWFFRIRGLVPFPVLFFFSRSDFLVKCEILWDSNFVCKLFDAQSWNENVKLSRSTRCWNGHRKNNFRFRSRWKNWRAN